MSDSCVRVLGGTEVLIVLTEWEAQAVANACRGVLMKADEVAQDARLTFEAERAVRILRTAYHRLLDQAAAT